MDAEEDTTDTIMVLPLKEEFYHAFGNSATAATRDALYHRIALATTDELVPLCNEYQEQNDGRANGELILTTALYHALYYSEIRFFHLLVEKGANHKLCGPDQTTVLMAGVQEARNHNSRIIGEEFAHYLLEKLQWGDLIDAQDKDGYTALHYANSDTTIIELLLKHGADPNIRTSEAGKTPLLHAAESGVPECGQVLLEYGAELNVTDDKGRNAMHLACKGIRRHRFQEGYGRTADFVQWLFDVGAQDMMIAKDCRERTPFDIVIWEFQAGHPVTNLLMQRYKDKVAAQEGVFCLHYILRTPLYVDPIVFLPIGNLNMDEMVDLLTLFVSEQSNPISIEDATGQIPLHAACQNSKMHTQVIQFLVDRNPNSVRHADHQGNLPIHTLCASRPSLNTVKYLLSKDEESVMATNHLGRSPLMVAAMFSASLDVLWYLMRTNPVVVILNFSHSK